MKYKNTPNKVKTLWKNISENTKNINNLKKYSIKYNSINYIKNHQKLVSDWQFCNYSSSFNCHGFEIDLIDFPDYILSTIKIVPIIKPKELEAIIENFNFNSYMKYIDSKTVKLKVDLYVSKIDESFIPAYYSKIIVYFQNINNHVKI